MISTTTMAPRNGSSGFTNFSIGKPLIAMPTNRQSPTGGVMWPIGGRYDAYYAEVDRVNAGSLRHRQQHRHGDENDLRRRQKSAEDQIEQDDQEQEKATIPVRSRRWRRRP